MNKRRLLLTGFLLLMISVTACQKSQPELLPSTAATIEYGDSELYSQVDMDAAIAQIRAEFDTWEGCELHSIRYTGDEHNNADNIKWMNELSEGKIFTQCIEFESDFHSPKNGGAWEADAEYTNWQWWLSRTDGGDWKLLTWGYG